MQVTYKNDRRSPIRSSVMKTFVPKTARPVYIVKNNTGSLQALAACMARALVDVPGAVKVTEVNGNRCTLLALSVAREDLGKIIGRQGRTAQAMRVLLNAAAAGGKKHVVLEIVD